ncbi:unnamed protein product [Mytilus coruscus]|uniref:Uncharacterized protein n=1 Tax=Mytilus coruscus TaxID=42192 RepID=A0A6J8EDU0_MYTCO|nr:unnamed protein product [Mytilus coruscus]
MRFFTYMFTVFVATTGFLLESNFPNNGTISSGTNKQFLTIAEFYETKKNQQHEHDELAHKIELMRHDNDKTLTLLTSQIQNKLSTLEHAVSKISAINKTDSFEQKYRELIANHTELQKQFDSLRTEYTSLANEQMVTQNKVKSLEEKMKSMGELKAVQQLQELTNLKDKVHTIESQTHSLAVHEQARSQDFLALYNHTIELGKKISVNSQQGRFVINTYVKIVVIKNNTYFVFCN